jgi:hypothetical protein
MINWKYTDSTNRVAYRVNEDGTVESCLASVLPQDTIIDPADIPPVVIPTEVSMRQARLALFQKGLLANVQPTIDGLTEPTKTITQISWDYATVVKRDDDLVLQLASALGIGSSALDDLFTLASTL